MAGATNEVCAGSAARGTGAGAGSCGTAGLRIGIGCGGVGAVDVDSAGVGGAGAKLDGSGICRVGSSVRDCSGMRIGNSPCGTATTGRSAVTAAFASGAMLACEVEVGDAETGATASLTIGVGAGEGVCATIT